MQSGFQSDHSFVWFEIDLADSPRGPGYWKFNVLHLNDKQIKIAANAIIDEASNTTGLNPGLLWERVKGEFIEVCKKYSRDKAKNQNAKIQEIQSKLDNLKAIIENSDTIQGTDIIQFRQLQNQLNEDLQIKAQGAQMRSKSRYYDMGERSSKYFFALEKVNARKKHLGKIRLQNGLITADKSVIFQELVK